MIAPKKVLACHGRVTRISNSPRKVGKMEHAQTVCTRLFSEKEPGNDAKVDICLKRNYKDFGYKALYVHELWCNCLFT